MIAANFLKSHKNNAVGSSWAVRQVQEICVISSSTLLKESLVQEGEFALFAKKRERVRCFVKAKYSCESTCDP